MDLLPRIALKMQALFRAAALAARKPGMHPAGLLSLALLPAVHEVSCADELQELRDDSYGHQWVLVTRDESRGIRTWARLEEGKRVRSWKIDAILNASLEAIARAHTDVAAMPRWYWETQEARMLKKVSRTEFYYYMRFNAPLGLPDRDGIFHAVIDPYNARRGSMVLRVNAVPDYLPESPRLVRVLSQDFVVKLTPLGKNKTRFEAEGYVDPGGVAPAWTVNFVQRRVPYLIMVSMIRQLQRQDGGSPDNDFQYTEAAP
ncbi:hypothetical protein EV700_3166 [Fluviicoccus keumensis]|uniref:START domain-containing protein n=1 Tax=Fluviicoccus keumensis TaxID=1435465 RepID=A0A4Q7YJJ4_9GAMM|nr:hypothetical protein [Fluviicoccus keumensis]RZU36953.1 hypothetical protein EV700_3166 [Fluviicoccus keumensis]